jgi:hypothetical protein
MSLCGLCAQLNFERLAFMHQSVPRHAQQHNDDDDGHGEEEEIVADEDGYRRGDDYE